jgi:hypothetical protein
MRHRAGIGHSDASQANIAKEEMMVAELISVYESADRGSGNPAQTQWNIFVGGTAYNTKNPLLAETARLAILANRKVTVIADANNKLSEIRIQVIPPPTKAKKRSA